CQTNAHKSLDELRLFGSYTQITCQGQIATRAGCDAVNGGDDDFLHLPDLPDHRVVLLAERSAQRAFLFGRPAFEILSGAEGPARASNYEASDFFIALTLFQDIQHFLIHLG